MQFKRGESHQPQRGQSMRTGTAACAAVAATLLVAGTATIGVAQDKDKDEVRKCDKPIGTLAVVEPQQQYIAALQRYGLGSPTGLIRMMVQNSNCFVVVERGVAMAKQLEFCTIMRM